MQLIIQLLLPVSIESFVGPVHREYRRTSVGFGHSTVPFEHYNFGPNLVIDLRPFIQHFLNVILRIKKQNKK